MTPEILRFLRKTRDHLRPTLGRVLEVGSQDVNGSPRSVFGDAGVYVGVDMTPGKGVDVVCDAADLTSVFVDDVFDVIVCCEMLEHCVRPWVAVEQMRSLLAPGGLLWVTTPTFGFPEHRYPVDCYRYGEDAYRLWLYEGMDVLCLEHLTGGGYTGIGAVGRKRIDLPTPHTTVVARSSS